MAPLSWCPDGHGHRRSQRELDEHVRHFMGCRSETTAADHHPVHPATAGIWHEPSYASGGADSQHLPRWASSWQGRISLRRPISATQVAGVAVQRCSLVSRPPVRAGESRCGASPERLRGLRRPGGPERRTN